MKPKATHRSESRRLEAKRQRSEHRVGLWTRLAQSIRPGVLLVWITFYLAALVILLPGGDSMSWKRDQIVDRDITARVPFSFEDRLETEKVHQDARASAPDVYVADPAPLQRIRSELNELVKLAGSAGGDAAKLKVEAAEKGWTIEPAAAEVLRQYAEEQDHKKFDEMATALLNRLQAEYLVERPPDPNRKGIPPTAILRGVDQAPEVAETELTHIANGEAVAKVIDRVVAERVAADAHACPPALRAPFAELITGVVLGRSQDEKPAPLWRYNPEATADEMEAAVRRVEVPMSSWKAGARLVPAGTKLTDSHLTVLKEEHQAFLLAQQTDPALRREKVLRQLGLAILALMVTVGVVVYTAKYQVRVCQNAARALGLAGLILLVVGLSRLNERAQYSLDSSLEVSVGLVVVAAALLTIAYNQRFALGAAGASAILVTLASRGDLGLFVTLMVATGVTVFALTDVRTRGKIIAVGAMAALGAGAASLASGLIAGQGLKYVVIHAVVAASAAVAAGFFVQGILHYLERLFGIATSMTLLEWCDASRPLLRRLAQEAPGTYSHSLLLSQMAEEAAEMIGARGLLARVGAIYHDIGKMQKAQYFVENQPAPMSRHARLSPTMSLLIIVGHVKDGIELARAYGLPRSLHQFIAEHHGTTVVRYFHHAAAEAAAKNSKTKGRHDREVSESEFRYPGPKPRTKESAILMICDNCEGAVRALSEPTPGRIESTVHQMVMDRLNDGQFDDCEISLRELHLVEQSVVKSLCAIHHGRIKYPKAASGPDQPADEDSGEAAEAKTHNGEREAPHQTINPTPEVVRQA